MKYLTRRLLIVLTVAVCAVACGFAAMFFQGRQAPKLGIVNGELKESPASPNCVNSFAQDELHAIRPFQSAAGQSELLLADLTAVIVRMPRTRLVEQSTNYRRFECRSRIFRFVDDLELLAIPEKDVVHVRSASRIGHSDLGVNRDRVESIRRAVDTKQD